MQQRNLTEVIERYLKSVLEQVSELEIKRSEIADKFECVPSQINYVINTRFTQQHGYLVESKRGGSGYIRIVKRQVHSAAEQIDYLSTLLRPAMSYKSCLLILQNLYANQLLTKREVRMLSSLLDKEQLHALSEKDEDLLRGQLMKHYLEQLRYEY